MQKNWRRWVDSLKAQPLGAIFSLGNMYIAISNAKDTLEHTTLRQDFVDLDQKITSEEVQLLWDTLFSIPLEEIEAMEEGNQKQIELVKKNIFQDFAVHKHLSVQKLLSCSLAYSREVFVALIRKHIENQAAAVQADPFEKFSYALLQSAGGETNFLYLNSFLAQCASLPVDDIYQLGEKDQKVAEQILRDLCNSYWYFKISNLFARKYPDLRAQIAENWKLYFETFPLTSEQRNEMNTLLEQLAHEYAEFSRVNLSNRIRYNYEAVQEEITPETWDRIGAATAAVFSLSLWGLYARKEVAVLGTAIACRLPMTCLAPMISAALTPWLVLEVACGIYYLGERYYQNHPPAEPARTPTLRM